MNASLRFRKVCIAAQCAVQDDGLMSNTAHLTIKNRHHIGVAVHTARHCYGIEGSSQVRADQATQFCLVGSHSSNHLFDLWGAMDTNQLRPDPEPVIRTQVPTTHQPPSYTLNVDASADRNRSHTMNPMIHRRSRRNDESCQLGLTARQLGDVVDELHSEGEFSASLTHVNSATAIDTINVVLKTQLMLTTIEEIYRARLKLLIKRFGKQSDLARAIGKSPSQISQWVNASPDSKTGKPRCMERQTAREIERSLNLPDGWMDQPVDEPDVIKQSSLQEDLAVYEITPNPVNSHLSDPSPSSSLQTIAKFMTRLNGLERNLAKSAIEYLLQDPSDYQRLLQVQIQIEKLQSGSGTEELKALLATGTKRTGTS